MLGHAPTFLFGTTVAQIQVQASSDIPADHLAIVFQKAASFWNISEIEAQDAYNRGDLTVTPIKENVYRAEMGGTWVDILISDNF